jgi:hypothetical protein
MQRYQRETNLSVQTSVFSKARQLVESTGQSIAHAGDRSGHDLQSFDRRCHAFLTGDDPPPKTPRESGKRRLSEGSVARLAQGRAGDESFRHRLATFQLVVS